MPIIGKDYKKRCSLILYLLWFGTLTVSAEAQSVDGEKAYLSIHSDITSYFVLIDHKAVTLQKVASGNLIEVPAGTHCITVIPECAAPFTFERNFHANSYHVAEISLNRVSGDRNSLFANLANGVKFEDLDDQIYSKEIAGSISFKRYTEESYQEYIDKENFSTYRDTYLKFTSNTDSLFVQTMASPKKTYRIANGDSILIEPGYRFIRLSHQFGNEYSVTKKFEEGQTTVINYVFELNGPTVATLTDNFAAKAYYGANLIVVSDEDSEIYIDEKYEGTGAANLFIEPGILDLTIKNPKTGISKRKIEHLPTENARVISAYTKPHKGTAFALGVLPGASQMYKRQKLKSALMAGGFVAISALAIKSHLNHQSELDEYSRVNELYRNTTDEQQALEYGDFLEQQEQKLSDLNKRRTLFWGITALVYAFNWFDVITSTPSSGYRSSTNLKVRLRPQVFQNKSYSSVSLNYDF